MHSRAIQLAASLVVVLASASPALAGRDWGTVEQSKACEKENNERASWGPAYTKTTYAILEAIKAGKVSDACKAELERRVPICMNDSYAKSVFMNKENEHAASDPHGYCIYSAFSQLGDQLDYEKMKQQAAEKDKAAEAQRAEEAKAKTASVELPKAEMHDAKLEKAVAAAYDRDYPGNKVLKVILGKWSEDYEKDAFGRVTGRDLDATVVNKHPDGVCELHNEFWMQHGNGKSFSGPLSARGAGSMNKTEILCSKAEAGGGASTGKKRK